MAELARSKLQKIQAFRDQIAAEELGVAELHSMFTAVSGRSLADVLTLRPTPHAPEDLWDVVDPDSDGDPLDMAWATTDGTWLPESAPRVDDDDIW